MKAEDDKKKSKKQPLYDILQKGTKAKGRKRAVSNPAVSILKNCRIIKRSSLMFYNIAITTDKRMP